MGDSAQPHAGVDSDTARVDRLVERAVLGVPRHILIIDACADLHGKDRLASFALAVRSTLAFRQSYGGARPSDGRAGLLPSAFHANGTVIAQWLTSIAKRRHAIMSRSPPDVSLVGKPRRAPDESRGL